jgi:hypothetical protein
VRYLTLFCCLLNDIYFRYNFFGRIFRQNDKWFFSN